LKPGNIVVFVLNFRIPGLKEKQAIEEFYREPAQVSFLQTEQPKISIEEIIGLKDVKTILQERMVLPLRFPQLFAGNRPTNPCFMLYGVSIECDHVTCLAVWLWKEFPH